MKASLNGWLFVYLHHMGIAYSRNLSYYSYKVILSSIARVAQSVRARDS